MKKSVGIIGGMGPMATVDLFRKIVAYTDASADSGHIRVYADSNTDIPDRTAAILSGGASPLDELIQSAMKLEAMGADFLAMACNTAHCFYADILPFIHVPFLHMPEETASALQRRGVQTVGLLATNGTLQTKLYDRILSEKGISVVYPSAEGQAQIMSLIYDGVKASNTTFPAGGVQKELDDMRRRGAEQFVLGCTELPLAFEMYGLTAPYIDPTAALAKSIVRFAGCKVKEI